MILFSKTKSALQQLDELLLWVLISLLSIGLVMVYSSSIGVAAASRFSGYQANYFLIRHVIFIVVGIAVGCIVFRVPVSTWQKNAPHIFLFGLFLLVVVFLPYIGKEVNGSRRWLSLFVINFQPSELMKLCVVLYAADYTQRKSNVGHLFKKAFLPMLLVMSLTGSLLLLEPDMGAFVVIFCVALCTLWLGGFNVKVFGGLLAALPFAIWALVYMAPYRMKRATSFWDPWSDPFNTGYQLSQALIAFGRGEWFGVGLGGSVEKLFYLPEAHTDFLMAVIAEELGLFGVFVVLVLFALFVVRAFQIGRHAAFLERNFAALVAQGIGVWIGVQAIINIGVNMGVLPTKGLTLPYLSFGGSGVVMNCVAAAMLLRIDYENRISVRP
ncbi:MAG: putative lipid II flippase FtsW [Gallionella sp.]|nr:putative lipid II flippase FtsW [Gallionella sp.]MDD4959520.1 putative lipid II flippase FtsW [Gallionella sp.]